MKKKPIAYAVLLAVLLALVLGSFAVPLKMNTSAAYNSCTVGTGTFTIVSTTWGTQTSPVQAGPNSQNQPLVVAVDYNGGCTATAIQASLGPLPSGFTDPNGANNASTFVSNIPAGSIFQLTYYLNLVQNVSLGTYGIPIYFTWNNTATNDLSQSSTVTVRLKGSVSLNFESANTLLIPGQVNNVVVTLSNMGTGNASQIQITSSPTGALASILNQIKQIPVLLPQTSTQFNLSVFVSSTAANSPISIALTPAYVDAYGYTRTSSQTLGFSVGTTPQPSFSLSISQQYVVAGATNNISLILTNTGAATMSNVVVTVTSQPPLTLVGSDGSFSLGNLSSGADSTVKLTTFVSPLATSPISLPVTVSFIDSSGNPHTQSRMLSFFANQSSALSPISVGVSPTILTAGKVNNVNLTISNTGSTQLSAISVSFAFPTSALVTWLNPASFQEQTLARGQNVTLLGQVYLAANAPTSSLLQVTATYYDSNGNQHQEITSIGLLSRGDIDVAVTSIIVTPQTLTPGQVFSVTLTLTNIGSTTATAVSATTNAPSQLKIFGSSSVFVGDMAASTPTPLTLTFIVQNNTLSGTYNIPVQLSYFDNLRNNVSQSVSIPISVVSGTVQPPSSTDTGQLRPRIGLTEIAIIVIVALATLAVGYFIGRRTKKR